MEWPSRDIQVLDESAWISRRNQDYQVHQEKFFALPLSKKQWSLKTGDQEAFFAELAMQASPPHSLLSPIYTPSKHHVSSMGLKLTTFLASARASVSTAIILPIGSSLQKWQKASGTPPLMCLSLWSPYKQWPINNGKAYQYQPASSIVCWVLLNIIHPASFHMLALAKHPSTCVHFKKMLVHVCAPAKHHLTQLTFQRNQKFPLQELFVGSVLRAQTALPKVLSSNPSNHIMPHNHL